MSAGAGAELQEVLEAEMTEALGAEKDERASGRSALVQRAWAAFCVRVAISSRYLAQLHRPRGGSASWAIGCAAGRLALIRFTTW